MRVGEWEFRQAANELTRGNTCIKMKPRCALVLQHRCEVAEVNQHTANPYFTTRLSSKGMASKPLSTLTMGVIIVLGLIFSFGRLFPSQQLPRVLYVADVANLTNDRTMNAVAAGASEILSSELAGASSLSIVRIRRRYGDNEWISPNIDNEELRPAPLLTASIVPTEQGADLVMQIEDGAERSVVWTHTFEISGADYAVAQREAAKELLKYYDIAENVSYAMYASGTLGVEEIYLRAKYLWGLRGRDNNMRAANLANRVLKLDPDYAPAHALLGEIYSKYSSAYLNIDTVDTGEMAKRHLKRAIEIDPDHPATLAAQTRQLMLFDRRPDLALGIADRMIELVPQESMAHRQRAEALYWLGRIDEALINLDKAMELEFGSPYVEVEQIFAHYLGARYEDVVKAAERISPEYLADSRQTIAASYYELGHHSEAMRTWLKALDEQGIEVGNRGELLRLVEIGRIREAYRALSQHVSAISEPENYQIRRMILAWSFYIGGNEYPLEVLMSVPINSSVGFLSWLHNWPLFNRFHDHPVMQEYLTRIGVAQYASCVHAVCSG